jgi:protein-disulfide isomerase
MSRFRRTLTVALLVTPAAALAVAAEEAPSARTNVLELASDAPALGSRSAPIVMIELVDYRCPYCAEQAGAAFDAVRQRYVDTGIVRYVAIDLPLPRHAEAERDAVAARCAGEQDAYWRAHRLLLGDRTELGGEGPLDLAAFAAAARIDAAALVACVDSKRHLDAVRADFARAAAIGADATPTFLFGFPNGGTGEVRVERHVVGAAGFEPVGAAIEALRESLRQRALREKVDH